MSAASRSPFPISGHLGRLLRYGGLSLLNIGITQGALVFAKTGLGWSGVEANLLATTVSALPAYVLSRRWVWNQRGKASAREASAFWLIAVIGLIVSTIAVAWADATWGSQLAVNSANLAAYGAMWIGKYLACDLLLFRDRGGSR